MADVNTALNIDTMYAQITAQLQAAFPVFKTVVFYEDDEDEQLPTPALLLELSEVEPDTNENGGEPNLPAQLRFEARVVLSQRTPNVKAAIRAQAMAVAGWLHNHSWGNGVNAEPCRVIACAKDEFEPNLDKWAVWRVEWINQAFLGASCYAAPGPMPDAFYSFAPKIGAAYKSDYTQLVQ